MKIKALKTEWFQDYKTPSMMIAMCYCDWKCDKECGKCVCQNSALAHSPDIEINTDDIIKRYLSNPITSNVIFGGLEPILQFNEVINFIDRLRNQYHCNDTVIIYTGYTKEEIADKIEMLKHYPNIIVKLGRFRPNQSKHYDEVLGVYLASDNQFAERIS